MSKLVAIAVCVIACVSFSGGYFINDAVQSSEEHAPEPVDGCIEKIIWNYLVDYDTSIFTIVGDCSLAGPSDHSLAKMYLSCRGTSYYTTDIVKIYSGMNIFYANVGADLDRTNVFLDCPHGRHSVEVVIDLQPWM